MNGRVYDPILARFLSADSIVEQPGLLQSHNRYSYALNNPLRYTDPSGHCVWDFCIAEIAAVVAGYELTQHGNSNWRMIGSLMMMVAGSNLVEAGLGSTAATFNIGNVGNAFTTAFSVNMVTSGGNFDQSFQSALFASAFSLAGTYTHVGTWQKFASHALIGCVQSASSGGKCGPGAAASMIGELTSEKADGLNPTSKILVSAIGGGTASVVGGGKFSSGAFQAGFLSLVKSMPQIYDEVVGFSLDAQPGGPAMDKDPLTRPYKNINNIGMQGKLDSSCLACEGGELSVIANNIPGVNAVAGLHDIFQISMGEVISRNFLNVPGMFVAATITYAGFLGDALNNIHSPLVISNPKAKKDGTNFITIR